MQKYEIENYSITERLKDGRQVTIRAIRPDDKGGMAEAMREVSAESFYRRIFSAKRELSDDDLKKLTEVDFENIVALVAVMKEEDQDRIVGGGRYVRTGTSEAGAKAEVAFLIDDAHQGLGIGSRIFRCLVTIARALGIAQFEAEVLPSNDGMLRLFTGSGLLVIKTMTRDSVHVIIDLNPDEKRAQPAHESRRPDN
jgi:RimJ/RimL family protein N-acetyltransferase